MQNGKFNVVTDGCWGSTGKGAIATALAWKHRPEILSTTNLANAGHSAVWVNGDKFVAKALPSPSILTKWSQTGFYNTYKPQIVIGATAAFTIDQLLKEIEECGININNLHIHPRAGVITEQHRIAETSGASSTKHLASTMQGCGTFMADKILRKKDLKLARDYPELNSYIINDSLPSKLAIASNHKTEIDGLSFPEILQFLLRKEYSILHEGAQGFSLDINHGSHYPACTSRGTTAIQNLADMGISARQLGDIYLVIRAHPIRVGNVIEDGKIVGYSGDCYDDHKEITWDDIAKESGMPNEVAVNLVKTELTTVTKRLRRVYSHSPKQVREAATVNGATKIALNFANYLDWGCYGMDDFGKLPDKVHKFIEHIEDLTKIPVTIVGTGPQINHVCFK